MCSMGFMTKDKAGQGDDVNLSKELCGYMYCVRTCIVMLENARSDILHETINDRLCMNPVNGEHYGCG